MTCSWSFLPALRAAYVDHCGERRYPYSPPVGRRPRRLLKEACSRMNVNGYITDRDVRAARELLRWSQQDLREKSEVGLATIRRFETGARITDDCKDKLVACLSKAGVIFFGRNEIEGVAVARGLALRPSARPKRAPKKRVYAARKPKEPIESND